MSRSEWEKQSSQGSAEEDPEREQAQQHEEKERREHPERGSGGPGQQGQQGQQQHPNQNPQRTRGQSSDQNGVSYVNVLASLQVSDFERTVEWYKRLFGRGPDRRPMDGCVEWQLTSSGGVQIYRNPEGAAAATIVVGLDDVETEAAELRGRGIEAELYDVPSGQFRLAELRDPSGNTVVLSQVLP